MLDFSVTFVITIINLAVLVIVLRVILWKPVTKFMEGRARRVQDSIEQSEKDKAQASALLAQYTEQLKTADSEAELIIRTAREHAEAEAERIIAESRTTAETMLSNTKKLLDMERREALAAFKKEAATLVVAAAGRLVGREIKGEDNQQYATMLLNETSLSEKAGNT
jgi:F-type H+-transporting ATPase subunit b